MSETTTDRALAQLLRDVENDYSSCPTSVQEAWDAYEAALPSSSPPAPPAPEEVGRTACPLCSGEGRVDRGMAVARLEEALALALPTPAVPPRAPAEAAEDALTEAVRRFFDAYDNVPGVDATEWALHQMREALATRLASSSPGGEPHVPGATPMPVVGWQNLLLDMADEHDEGRAADVGIEPEVGGDPPPETPDGRALRALAELLPSLFAASRLSAPSDDAATPGAGERCEDKRCVSNGGRTYCDACFAVALANTPEARTARSAPAAEATTPAATLPASPSEEGRAND